MKATTYRLVKLGSASETITRGDFAKCESKMEELIERYVSEGYIIDRWSSATVVISRRDTRFKLTIQTVR